MIQLPSFYDPTANLCPQAQCDLLFLLAAKTIITRLWKTLMLLMVTSWFQEIFYLQRMEELRAESRKTSLCNAGIWSAWVSFWSTPEYQTYL